MNCLTLFSTKCSTSFPVLDFQLIVLDPPVSSWVPEALSSSAWVAGPLVAPGSPQGPADTCVQPHSCSRPLLSAHRWRIRRVSGLSRTVSPSVQLRRPSWWRPGEGPLPVCSRACALCVSVTGTCVPVSTASGGQLHPWWEHMASETVSRTARHRGLPLPPVTSPGRKPEFLVARVGPPWG